MARKYNIIERLKAKNEKPFVQIDEDHCYNINTSKTNVMAIMALYSESNNENIDNLKLIDKTIEMGLGKEALEYINSLDMTMAATSEIVSAIMAGISDIEIEEIEEKAKKGKK